MKNERIVYLSVPESLGSRFDEERDGFSIDPSIPIPVEIPPGESKLDLENLSWEMIVSGMIRVVSDSKHQESDTSAEDAAYYRRFILAVKPDILDEFSQAAIMKARNGAFALAAEIFNALEALFPENPQVLMNRALVRDVWLSKKREANGEADADDELEILAFEAWKQVLHLEPPFPPAFFNAAFFYMRLNNFTKAKECLDKYIRLGDDGSKKERAKKLVHEIESRELDDELFKEAFDAIREGREETGIANARQFIERHPEVWNAWFILGWGLRRTGAFAEAVEAFRTAIEKGGDNCDSHNELAICLMETGDYAGSRRELESALRQEGENTKVISNLGVLALKEGNTDEAAGFFRTVLALDENDQIAKAYFDGKL